MAICRRPELDRAASDAGVYAKLMALRILEGNLAQVIKGLRQTVTKRHLVGAKKKALLEVAAYFENNRGRMRYNAYLARALPIASGPVEEAVVTLRSLCRSGDFEDYWPFHVSQDRLRLHPPGLWSVAAE